MPAPTSTITAQLIDELGCRCGYDGRGFPHVEDSRPHPVGGWAVVLDCGRTTHVTPADLAR